jgi:hypothetical protein
MPDYSRVSLPSNFYDITSDMLLAQPEPQYLYARMWLNSLSASMLVPEKLGLVGRGVTPEAGGAYTSADADRLLLSDPVSTELIIGQVNFSGLPGHTMRFNRPRFTNSTYTQASRRIARDQTLSTTTITVDGEQTELTLELFGGPYDSTASAIRPYGIDQFDAQLGVHKASSIHGTHLKRDLDRFVDTVQVLLLDNANSTVYPEGMTADNDATVAGEFPLTYEQISRCAKEMDEENLPTLSDGRRVLVITPTGAKQLKDDPQFARYVEQHTKHNPLYDAMYFGMTPEFHCFKSNTLRVVDNGSSIGIHYAHAIAPGALFSGIGSVPNGSGPGPRVVAATDDNYGLSQKVLWLMAAGFGLADDRFVKSVRYTEDAQ